MAETKTAALWRRALASIIDVAVFWGLSLALAQYVAPHFIPCGGKFCKFDYLVFSILFLALAATIFNSLKRRSLGDICLRIRHYNSDGRAVSAAQMVGLQFFKYLFIGLCFYLSVTGQHMNIAKMVYKKPPLVMTQAMKEHSIKNGDYLPRNVVIVPEAEYPEKLQQYTVQFKELDQKLRFLSYTNATIMALALGYFYLCLSHRHLQKTRRRSRNP